ncbi:MAG: aminoacyl-tRNA hydrolase [Candidatus Margulisiibacteriota bacterium]|jgi:PTH1 family peptidyl-tRNA hydrolase
MFLVVGLGNPGAEYAKTRHNLGFRVVDELAGRLKLSFRAKHQALIAEGQVGDHKTSLAQPQTYMNNSGQSVKEIVSWHKLPNEKLIVIYDDVDLEVGQVRVRESGSAGGHHGIESIMSHLNSGAFVRIRIGIGRPSAGGDVANYVLGRIAADQQEALALAIQTAADAALEAILHGTAAAMNKFNR